MSLQAKLLLSTLAVVLSVSSSNALQALQNELQLSADVRLALDYLEQRGAAGEEHSRWIQRHLNSRQFFVVSSHPILENNPKYRGAALPPRHIGGAPTVALRTLDQMSAVYPDEQENLEAFIVRLTEEIVHAVDHVNNLQTGSYSQEDLDNAHLVLDQMHLPDVRAEIPLDAIHSISLMCMFIESRVQPEIARLARDLGVISDDRHLWSYGKKAKQCLSDLPISIAEKIAKIAIDSQDYMEFKRRLPEIFLPASTAP